MTYRKEPDFTHGGVERTGVLLVNLGTPDAPTPAAVRRYLEEFLSDPRVVEIPRWIWRVILHGIILRTRPAKSAAKYASIWSRDGSPLRVWTEKQSRLLQGHWGERGIPVVVRHAMRYGQPSIANTLDEMKRQGVTRVLILPLYPQYSAATTASVLDDVFAWGLRTRRIPELRTVSQFADDAGYISALAERVRAHNKLEGKADKLVMSFHGMPERSLALGDPYHCQCHKTARLLAENLGLGPKDYVVTFQSRFGAAKWLQPYTDATLRELGRGGVQRVDVVCPGFVSDCLETLEEIAIEGKQTFLAAGGKTFHYISCLNDDPAWIRALGDLARRHLEGWSLVSSSAADLELQRQRALALGAKQ